MLTKLLLSFIIFLSFTKITFGQVTVTFPSDRVVFQRSNANTAAVIIAGYFSGCVDRVEARFVPRNAGQGAEYPLGGGWAVIQNNPTGGNFYGALTVTGGWYTLQVRTILDNNQVASNSVEHVGIGEVFVVAGQSNATGGDSNANGPGATDDRVNSVNFQNLNANNQSGIAPYKEIQLPCPEFVHLDADTKTSPFGNYAWCWGAFGDKLVKKLNVPVMIFNAGWSSTGIKNWQQTINPDGITTSEFGYTFPAGLPFGHLRIALNNYIAQLGVRAVLWHQGETDNFSNRTQSDYLKDIREVIQASRDLSGKSNLAWVVSRVSRFTVDGSSRIWQPVIDAQNDVIGIGSQGDDPNYKLPNVFEGPATDDFWDTNYRSDQVHFSGEGLIHLAGWWTDKINNNFIQQSTPYAATPPPNISLNRSETAAITLRGPGGWEGYNWLSPNNCSVSVANTEAVISTQDYYKLKVTDQYKNVVFSPLVKIPTDQFPSSISRNNDISNQIIYNQTNIAAASNCRIMAKVTPAENSPLLAKTLAIQSFIDPTVGAYLNAPYLQRHYDLKNDSGNDLNSKITLYYSQAEFDAFNKISSILLPSQANDQAGKNNLRLVHFSGTSPDGTLGSYNGARTEIIPLSVLWNPTLTNWEITFNATVSGGFFISTFNSALPVTWKYFTGNVNKAHVSLKWATESETNASVFNIQRSKDAVTFETIGTVAAAGESKSMREYLFDDSSLENGIYYYRLQQLDIDGSYEFTRIISLKVNERTEIKIYPNPVSERLNIQSEIEINSVEIINSMGIKSYTKSPKTHFFNLEMVNFTPGLYIIKINGAPFKIIKN